MKTILTVVLLACRLAVSAQNAAPYELVIDEIMADPSPVIGLPNAEFIEIKNASTRAFNLNRWRIGDANGFATVSTNFILQPDSFVIICASSNTPVFSVLGAAIGLSNFPSLDNDADELYLRSPEGRTIHAIAYSSGWYQNAVKKQGGWTLEMIDTKNPCQGSGNWTASQGNSGGTPGKKNSVDAVNKDLQSPVLLRAFAADSTHIMLSFSESLDSLAATKAVSYVVSDGIGRPLSVMAWPPLFNTVELSTAFIIQKNKVYAVAASGVTDCAGNTILASNTIKMGRATPADTGSIIINEVLFNPRPDGADYIELYNRSTAILDLKDCYISNRSANNAIGPLKQISTMPRLLFPGEYLLLTEDELAVQKQYLAKDPSAFLPVSGLPSMPDDKGDILIFNEQGKIIDELAYDAHWHFKLIDNEEGVSLERIDYLQPTQHAANWHSAATSAGYGTPGYQNSQFKNNLQLHGTLSITPAVFSPDNDGFDDFLTLSYQFPEPGYVCNIRFFDDRGRLVRYLTHNAICGLQGYFRWDGLGEQNNRLPIGVYIMLADVFNLQGKTNNFKQAVTLARTLQ